MFHRMFSYLGWDRASKNLRQEMLKNLERSQEALDKINKLCVSFKETNVKSKRQSVALIEMFDHLKGIPKLLKTGTDG